MRFAYPVMLDVTERLVVIIGGGAVAARKANTLLECGATRIRVVAPDMQAMLPASVVRVREPYEARHLEGAQLVFAATDSAEVNDRVVRDAQERGVMVNRADEGDPPGDFVVPARLQLGEIVLGVTAGSAALAVSLRDHLARFIDGRHTKMALAMQTMRPLVRQRAAQERRSSIFRDLASREALDVLDSGGESALRTWISRKYPELKL